MGRKIDEICARIESRSDSQASDEEAHLRFSPSDIPQGLVKKNREIVQHEQVLPC